MVLFLTNWWRFDDPILGSMILLLSVLFGRRMSVQSTLGNVLEFTGEFKNRSVKNIGNNADILTGLRVQVYKKRTFWKLFNLYHDSAKREQGWKASLSHRLRKIWKEAARVVLCNKQLVFCFQNCSTVRKKCYNSRDFFFFERGLKAD